MLNTITETSETGWFGRIRESIKGLLFGFVLFAVSFPVLWFNEKNSAETIAGLNQLVTEAVTVGSDTIDPSHEGRPVHTIGRAETEEILRDGRFGVAVKAIKLVRDVEMYQWQENSETEERKKVGGGSETVTTYTYEKVWSDQQINSSQFNPQGRTEHSNPSMPYGSEMYQAKDVSLGAFELSPFLVAQMNDRVEFALDSAQRDKLPADMRGKLQADGPGYYQGTPGAPEIGDLRINFSVVQPDTVSVIATQTGGTFQRYTARNGKDFGLLEMGERDKESVIKAAQDRNWLRTWGWRLAGCVIMFFGLTMILRPLSVLGDLIPLVGDIVGAGTALIAGVISVSFSLMTISVAWVFYRPLLGVPLALASLGLIFFAFSRVRNQKKQRAESRTRPRRPAQTQPKEAPEYRIPLPSMSPPAPAGKIACPHCSQHIQYEPAHGGMTIDCPTCAQELLIPHATA